MKKSVDGTPKYRFCTDFRGLNAVTKIPAYPIPDIKVNLSLMAGSRYFTLLGVESAYWHIPIHPDDKDKTGFVMPFGSVQYERLANDLAGAASTFQKIMDVTLMGLKDIYALVYLDDILKNTKLVTFSEVDYIYLKEMAIGVEKNKKFRNRWRGPYLITKRFSDLN